MVLAVLSMLTLNGCLVAESSYLKKVDEVDSLNKNLIELQFKHETLATDNSVLKTQVEKLNSEAVVLTKEKLTLMLDKKQLEDLLNAKTDTLSKNISDLRQKISDLEKENGRLKEEITVLTKARVEKIKEVSSTYEQLLLNMKNEIAQGQVTISELKGKLTVNIESYILFDSGKADVKPEGLSILGKMIATLKSVSNKAIRIEGYTDNAHIDGGLTPLFPSNWELSVARALNVTKFLWQHGIDPANLSAVVFAEYKPAAEKGTREGRAKNGRIEITLVARD
jgi:chemotaxis protein MotB